VKLSRSWIAIPGAAAVAAAVRLPGVVGQALSQDEVASARILHEPSLAAMLARVARTESTPPLWYTLAWLVHRIGVPLTDVRLLSVLAGCGLAAAVVAAGRCVLTDGAALLAGLLVAVGNEFVVHGHELRAYELLAFLSAVFLWLLLHEATAPSRVNATGLGVVVAAGGLTHYFFAPVALAALIWVALDPAARACRRAVLIAIAAGGAVAAAWAPVMLVQYHRDRFWWIGPFDLRQVVAAPLRLFTLVWADTPPGLALSVASLAVLAVGCRALTRSGRAGRLVVALAVGPLAIAASLWAAGVHVFALRNMIELGPPVALVVGAFVARVAERAGVAAAIVVAGIVLVLPFGEAAGSVPPFGGIAHALVAEGWRPSDPLAVFGNFFVYRAPLEWYLPGSPHLDAARPRARACRTVFVVADDRLPPRLDARVVRETSSEGYVVARLALAAPRFRGAALLDDPAAASGCVRPIRTGRLAPIA
jgi:Dolichyl-phosphate-mannose-protein mannosyltransferase